MRRQFNPLLYLVTDNALCEPRTVAEVVHLALRGGVTMVQFRDKTASDAEFVAIALVIREVVAASGARFIINDRAHLCAACKADGIHIGASDIPPAEARKLIGPYAILGLSVTGLDEAQAACNLDSVDYYAASPIFATPTKTDTGSPWGLEGIPALRNLISKPLIGIGGLNISNASAALRAGLDGIAVVSAICSAPDPVAAARELRKSVE